MTEPNRSRDEAVAQLIALAALVVAYWYGTHAASIEIEVRARWRKLRLAWESARAGEEAGRKVAEWFVRDETPKVIDAAERITRGEG